MLISLPAKSQILNQDADRVCMLFGQATLKNSHLKLRILRHANTAISIMCFMSKGHLVMKYQTSFRWGRICDVYWTIQDANIVCRQLGYSGMLQGVNFMHDFVNTV